MIHLLPLKLVTKSIKIDKLTYKKYYILLKNKLEDNYYLNNI